MSVFTSKLSPATGKPQWILQDENYDYHQEIARSAYADMLHDTERNQKYEAGLIAAIQSMRSKGKPCNVLDIGTGTGLLSMMAVRNGADTVHACDAFEPAAKCAARIIEANGMSGRIQLIHKRSTDISVPSDMPSKANILVTEVFDTELIGEGAIGTFRHALEHLLEPDCIVVPSAARMYVQPVDSSYLSTRNELSLALPPSAGTVSMPADIERYNNGLAAPLFDLQLSQLPADLFSILSKPQVVFRFDFCGRQPLPVDNETDTVFTAERDGVCHAFFMWWDLDMDMAGDIKLSCAPYWEHPQPRDVMQWRDHWMQAVFYPSRSLTVQKGSDYTLCSQHDEYSLSFDVSPFEASGCLDSSASGESSDILHCVYTRSRLATLHDEPSIAKYSAVLTKVIDGSAVVLCASDGSFLPFLLARLGAKKIFVVESNFIGARRITQSIIDHNKLSETICVCGSYDDIGEETLKKVTLLVGEPYFALSMLPWDDLLFWYMRSKLNPGVKVCPRSCRLVALAVQFDDLHRIRQPVRACEGLDLKLYDEMIEDARMRSDDCLEPHFLWEYPCKALSQPRTLLEFDLVKSPNDSEVAVLTSTGHIPIMSAGEWNGVAVWMRYELDDDNHVSFGALGEPEVGEYVKWNMERKQAVYLPLNSVDVEPHRASLTYDASFRLEDGDMQLSFSVS